LALSFFKIRLKPDYRIEIEMTTDNFHGGPSHSIGNNADVRDEEVRGQSLNSELSSRSLNFSINLANVCLISHGHTQTHTDIGPFGRCIRSFHFLKAGKIGASRFIAQKLPIAAR